MSDALNLRAQITRIDRSIAETEKLQEEIRKFVAEQNKLAAEARKIGRDYWLAPAGIVIAALSSLGALIAVLVK